MATSYSASAQMGETGIAYIRSIVTGAGLIYRPFENTDFGVDGAIEFINENREPSGDIVLVQAKAGASFIRDNDYILKSDRNHFETWARYSLPVVGIVYNPGKKDARWVNISEHLVQNPELIASGPFHIKAPGNQRFTRIGIKSFIEIFRNVPPIIGGVETLPNLSIRAWKPQDAKPTRVLLTSISEDYPDFYNWLGKQWKDPKVSKKVVQVGDTIAAYSMWKKKDDRNIKLQTFIVGPRFQGSAVGQHLLYHEIRNWAEDTKIERVYVTISSRKSDLIAYFYKFGFRVEGIAANRYPRNPDAAEVVLGKHFIRDVVTNPGQLESMKNSLCHKIWGISETPIFSSKIFGVTGNNFFFPFHVREGTAVLDSRETSVNPRVTIIGKRDKILREFNDYDLMREFYPLKIFLRNKNYIAVPIKPNYSRELLGLRPDDSELTQLKMRVDHTYYCTPRHTDLRAGDFVLFYETKHGGNVGGALGTALVRECMVNTPEVLWKEYNKRGVFKLKDIQGHKNSEGNSMAIHFDYFEPFKKSVSLNRIRTLLGRNTVFQTLTALSREEFLSIIGEGNKIDE
jgi:ribosomal protein S18 acetylase RimI-like enzyme